MTWYGLVTADADRAISLLDALWDDLAASDLDDRFVNNWVVNTSRVGSMGVPLPQVSPYFLPGASKGQRRIEEVLHRHIDFDAIPDLCRQEVPEWNKPNRSSKTRRAIRAVSTATGTVSPANRFHNYRQNDLLSVNVLLALIPLRAVRSGYLCRK